MVPTPTGGATILTLDIPLKQFKKNTSLEQFAIRATQDVALDVLPYFLEHPHFAPELRTLELILPDWNPTTTIHFTKLKLLDKLIHTRLLVHNIIFWCEWDKWPKRWSEVENRTRLCLPHCEENGLLKFRLRPQEQVQF